jgi:hypothetical protein
MAAIEHIYVYYRLQGDADAARAAVGALFADLEAQTGVCGRLLARSDDPQTWMEVYEPVPQAADFICALAQAEQRHGLPAHAADAQRHVERFVAASAAACQLLPL